MDILTPSYCWMKISIPLTPHLVLFHMSQLPTEEMGVKMVVKADRSGVCPCVEYCTGLMFCVRMQLSVVRVPPPSPV